MNLKENFLAHKKRVITAIVLISIVLIVAFIDNNFVTWAFLGCVYLVAFYEAMKLFRIENNSFYAYALAIWLFAFIYPNPEDVSYFILLSAISYMVHKKELNLKALAPFVYPTVSMLFLYSLYFKFGIYSLLWLVVIVALTDTFAYIVGKSFGKTPFSKTSPNKTWEGVLGGIVVATLGGTFVGLGEVNLFGAFVITLLVSLSSVWGDLFESYLKRKAGVKDSGTIFPGHGGMLDRIDGYMFASVIMLTLLKGIL